MELTRYFCNQVFLEYVPSSSASLLSSIGITTKLTKAENKYVTLESVEYYESEKVKPDDKLNMDMEIPAYPQVFFERLNERLTFNSQ